MSYPTAVSPSQLTPGLYLTVDLLAGTASPGTGQLVVALLAPKGTDGDLTVDTELRLLGGIYDAELAWEEGSPGYLAAKKIYDRFPSAQIYAAAPTAGAGTATIGITFSGSVGADGNVVDCDIHGVEFELSWLSGETATQMNAKLRAAISARNKQLAVEGVDGGVGLTTINAKGTGNIYEDILVRVKLRNTATGTEAIAGALTHTALAGATTDPDFTTVLTLLAGKEFHFILPCLSNADVTSVASSNNLDKVVGHINAYNTGLGAKLQTVIVGCSSTIALSTASTPHANSGNNAHFGQYVLCMTGRDLPCEYAAAELGGWLNKLLTEDDASGNRIGELHDDLAGAFNKVTELPTPTECETALAAGVSILTYTAQDIPQIVRPITTHSQFSSGGADTRLLDMQHVHGTYIIARDLRESLPAEFPQAKITPDTPEGEEPPPEGVIEERDIKAFIVSRLMFWVRKGVATRASVEAAIADGTLIVRVNATDATQVDIVVPFSIVPPLAKFGVVVQRVPN